MGLVTAVGDFSNVRLIAVQPDGTESTLVDYSADNTDRTILPLQFTPTGFSAIRLELHAADDVTITSVFIPKAFTTISRIQALSELTGQVENISSYRSALNVSSAWVHRKIVNEAFFQNTGTSTTPSVAVTEGDTSITFTSVAGFVIGSEFRIYEGPISENGEITITNIVGNVVTLDRPVGNDFTTAAVIDEVLTNMAVVGSLAAPQSFIIKPPVGTIWQITRILPTILDSTSMDDGLFGGIAALTNGVSLRAVTSAGRTIVFANWKTNGQMRSDMYNVDYLSKAPAGQFGLGGRWTFTNAEVVAELDGDATSPPQQLEVLIQDDLTGLDEFILKGQGRVFSP